MFETETYIKDLSEALKSRFSNRFLYLGIQGSYRRGEATEKSDIDIVVILETLTVTDLDAYKEIINRLPYPERSCGFICGKEEMLNWNPLDICNFSLSTKDCFGKLVDFVPKYTREDVANSVKQRVGDIYHELCHRYVHGNREDTVSALPAIFKSIFFILQNVYFLECGTFYLSKTEIFPHLTAEDKNILETATHLAENGEYDFEEAFSTLMNWCQRTLCCDFI